MSVNQKYPSGRPLSLGKDVNIILLLLVMDAIYGLNVT